MNEITKVQIKDATLYHADCWDVFDDIGKVDVVVTDPHGIIIDPFLGSGSTIIACEKTNRRCYGMEIDPHYCDVIIRRWEECTGKKAVLNN